MKTLKIRFVKRADDYLIQRRTWWGGWKYIQYVQEMGYATISWCYSGNTKKELLADVLEKYYKTDKKFVQVTEYPGLLIY